MPIFRCSKCGCIENTATSYYWMAEDRTKSLCSECDPDIGKWHGKWEKTSAKGFFLDNYGFLHSKEEIESDNFKWRMEHQDLKIVSEITED